MSDVIVLCCYTYEVINQAHKEIAWTHIIDTVCRTPCIRIKVGLMFHHSEWQ